MLPHFKKTMKIYGGIEGIELPEPDYKNYDWKKEEAREMEYIKKVQDYAKANYKGKYVGKELSVPYADGHARYIVLCEKPMQLIHLAIGDAWDDPNVHYMTAKGIKETIDRQERFSEMWARNKARQNAE